MFRASDKQSDSESLSHDCKTILLDFVDNPLHVPKRKVQIRFQISHNFSTSTLCPALQLNKPANVAAN